MATTIRRLVRDILVSVSESFHGESKPATRVVQQWSIEVKNDLSIPTAQDDRINLQSDRTKVIRDMNKAFSKYKQQCLMA